MKFSARLSVITLGADDLELMRNFYAGILGWEIETRNKDVVFFKIPGCLFSLCNKKLLAGFIGVHHCGLGFRGVTFGYNVATKEEVDELHGDLVSKQVNIIKSPTMTSFGGYFFYFTDVEGNILEVAYNPYVPLDEKGNVLGHKEIAHVADL
jgi:catechol-2,3-dioxygenase